MANKKYDEVNKEIKRMADNRISFQKEQRKKAEARESVRDKMLMDELEVWFDKKIMKRGGLPKEKKELLKNKNPILFALWNERSPEERKQAAIDTDYQNDPATEKERERIFELITEREEWEQVETPTALDKAKQEEKLKEIRAELESFYNGSHPLCCDKYRKGTEIIDTEPPELKRKQQKQKTEERNDRLQQVMDELAKEKKKKDEFYTRDSLANEMSKMEEFKNISKDVILRATKKPK